VRAPSPPRPPSYDVRMSQYRDDLDAAHLRIEGLEARLADREAELARRSAALVARDEEIVRLQRGLELAGGLGPRHMRSVSAAWASRIVGAATGLAIVAAGAGVILVRGSASASPAPAVAPSGEPEATAPVDPPPASPGGWGTEAPEPAGETAQLAPPAEMEIRRRLEARVWGGRASQDEIRMLKAICSHQGDRACRERARAALERARAGEP
jgi:hypothetical protein